MVKIDGIEYQLSERKDKKLKAFVNNGWIHFGQVGYEHYFDRTKLLNQKLNHMDKQRRKEYIARASNIKNKEKKLTKDDINSANYHAIRILW
jgi:Skp family chaperone for outer membrane proteins